MTFSRLKIAAVALLLAAPALAQGANPQLKPDSLATGAATANLGFTPLNPANNLSELASASTARNNLGLGALATQNTLGSGAVTASMLATGAAASNIGVGGVTASMLASGAAAANLGFSFAFVSLNSSNGSTDFFDLSAARQFEIYPFPGAVNYYAIQGNIANGGPALSAQGSDANIDANISAKGTGNVVLGNGLGVLAQFQAQSGLSASAWPVLQSVQGSTAIYTAGGYSSNISIGILPIGTGGFFAGPGHTVTGTNATALGSSNKASGYASAAIGIASYAQGAYSLSTGAYSFDNSVVGKRSHSSAHLGSARGTTQISEQAFAIQTTSATPVTATSDGGGSSTLNTIQVQANQTVASRILVVARNTTTGASAMWNVLAYWNEGATASTLALVYSTGAGAPVASTGTGNTWTATLGTNTTTGYGYVICTGAAGETIRWTVRVDNVEDMNG
jgi:hypothetical protein